jgi:hypothetical protein
MVCGKSSGKTSQSTFKRRWLKINFHHHIELHPRKSGATKSGGRKKLLLEKQHRDALLQKGANPLSPTLCAINGQFTSTFSCTRENHRSFYNKIF